MPERFKVTKTAEADVEYASNAASASAAGRRSPATPLDEEAALGHHLLGGDKIDGKFAKSATVHNTKTFYKRLCAYRRTRTRTPACRRTISGELYTFIIFVHFCLFK